MNFCKRMLSISILMFVLGSVGCGVTSQDKGLGDSAGYQVSGVGVDGYVTFGLVYVDTNENNKLDIWEPNALTDRDGYFTYNPISNVKYCELPLKKGKLIHKNCLKMPAGYADVVIRISGGYDSVTADPFTGTLSMRVDTSTGLAQAMIGTPITGLLAEMTVAEKAKFLADEGIESGAGNDFLDFSENNSLKDNDALRLTMLTLALRVHKISDSVAGYLNVKIASALGKGDSEIFGSVEGMPADASVYVYQAIVEHMREGTKKVSKILTNEALLAGVISTAMAKMKNVISALDTKDKYDFTAGYSDPDLTEISANAKKLADIIGGVFTSPLIIETYSYTDSKGDPQSNDYSKEDDVKGRIRAADIIASLVRSGAVAAAVDNAISLAGDPVYLTHLKNSAVDVQGLKKIFTDKPGAVVAADADYTDRQTFAALFGDIGGTGLSGENTSGFAGNNLDISDSGDGVGIAFAGDSDDATNGTMVIDASFGGDEILALEGTWEQIDEYTMLMNVEVAGVVEPVIVKPTLVDDGAGGKKTAYYFDLGGEQQVWVP